MEELQTIEPPQQQDPPIKKLYNGLFSDGKYTKSFDEFRKQYSTPEAIDKLYNGLHEDNDYTKSKEEFQQQYFTEVKKKSGSNDLPPVLDNGLSTIPTTEIQETQEKDPVTLSLQADELGKKTKSVGEYNPETGSVPTTVPDEDAKKEAKLLKDEVKVRYGFDADELANEHKGLTDNDYGKQGFSKEELLADKRQNPELYQRKLSRLKWQSGFDSVLADNLVNGNISKETYDGLSHAINSSLQNSSIGDYVQQRDNINYVANAIKQFGGVQSDKLLKDYAVEVGKVYGNSYKSISAKNPQETPESKYLNPDAELGFQYLKDISPDKAEQYNRLFIYPKTLKDKPDEQKGYNYLMQTLEETGIGLQENAVKEDLNNLKNISEKNNGLTPEQLAQAKVLEAKQTEIQTKKNDLDAKYPDRLNDKVDDAMQEILGQKIGWGNYAGGMAGKAIKNTAEGLWESVSEPFMSDASNKMRELAIMGESLDDANVYHKTDANKNFQTDQLMIKPELQSEVDLIKNDKSLTREQKEAKLYPLLKANSDKFGRVPIQGGRFNISPSSILYGLTDIGTTLLPFLGLEAATGGIGGSGTAAKFLRTFTAAAATGFHDEYANAIMEGKPESEAYKQAMGMTAISAAAMGGAGTAEKVRAMYNGAKSSAAKIIEGMSNEAIEKVLSDNSNKITKSLKFIRGIGDRASATPKMITQGLKTGTEFETAMTGANELKHQLYNTPIDREQNFKQSLLGIANFGILGAGLGHIGYKNPTELQKSGFVEMGKNPEEFKATAQQMLKDGQLTKTEFDHRNLLIEKSAEAQKTLPTANAKGKPLTEKEKADYIYNSVVKNEGNKAASNLPPKQAEKAAHTALVADFKNDLILEPKTTDQLESRKNALTKILEPKKDESGKAIELNPTVEKESKAELQAINEVQEENSVKVADEAAKRLSQKSEPKPTVKSEEGNTENKPIQNEENQAAEVVKPTEETGNTNEPTNQDQQQAGEGEGGGGEENKVGVSHESLSKLSEKLGLAQPSRGDYIEPSQYAERGRQLLNNGASLDEVDNTSNDLHDRISIARAHLEDLVSNADKIAKSEGMKSEEYKNAVKEIEKYYVDKVKKLGTLAHRAFVSLQGERDLNTGSFTVVKKEFENNQGSKATPEQEQKINDLVKANNDLKQQLDALDKRLIEETEKNINAEKLKQKLSEKAKKIANTVRRLKLSRPNTFSAATPASLVWDGAVEVAAKIIEASGSIADAVENGIEHIRNSEWYKGLSDDKKNNAEKDFEDAVNNKREKTSEEKRVENLEKQLKDLQEGKIKPGKDKIVRTEREKALIKQIKEEKEALGLNDKIKPVKGSLPVDENISKVNDLISKFVDKKGNKFTPDEAKSIWAYGKSEYLNKSVDYRDMISYVANDLGLSFDQVYHAITTTKTKPISDAAWRKSADLRMSQIKTKDYVDKADRSGLSRAYHAIADPFRSVAVFGHGHIFVGTHAGMTLFDLPRAHHTIKAFFNGIRFAYGNTPFYERSMAQLKNDPNYTIADRAGLQNNPNETNSDDYQKFSKGWGKALSKIGLTGVKGFNAIKVLRQNLFNAHFNKLNAAQKADPSVAESIAHLVNNATGATNLTLPKWTQEVSFAGNMEAARWEKLTANPLNATKTALKAIITPDKVTDAEKVFAKVWASRVGWQIATYAGILAVNAAIQNTLNPKNKVNLTRPNDPDYLKMKVADKDVNMTSGMLGTIGFITKLVHESGESQKELKGDTRLKAFGKSAATYGRGKLSPFYATIADLVTQQDFARNPLPFSKDKPTGTAHTLTWGEYAWQKAPIPVADAAKTVYEEMQANGMSKPHIEQFFSGLATMAETSSTGFRVNDSYKKKYEINFSEGIQKFVDDKKIEIPSPKQTYTEDKEEVTIPDDKYEEYKANRAKRIENDLTNLKDNPPVNETYQEAVKKIVERANKNARSEVVGVVNKKKPEGYFKNDIPLPVHAVHK